MVGGHDDADPPSNLNVTDPEVKCRSQDAVCCSILWTDPKLGTDAGQATALRDGVTRRCAQDCVDCWLMDR